MHFGIVFIGNYGAIIKRLGCLQLNLPKFWIFVVIGIVC